MRKILLLFAVVTSFILIQSCKKSNSIQENKNIESLTFSSKRSQPINGVLKGVIELGASGFNSFIVEVDKNNNYLVKRKEFGSSLLIEGMTNANEINDKLKEYIKKVIEFGVPPKNIYFVMSSGAKMSEIAKQVTPKLKSIGYTIYEVNAKQEGIYAFKSVLPKGFKKNAFVVDIGSGNTKISYFKGDSIHVKETYGSKYFQKGILDDEVYKNVRLITQSIPKEKTEFCFIIGGAPFYMANTFRKDQERFTMLSTDISTYNSLIKDKGKKVESGVNIFKAIADQTNCKQFVFDWDANFTIGFLLDIEDNKK